MSKKKLICVLGGVVILIMTAFVELSLERTKRLFL